MASNIEADKTEFLVLDSDGIQCRIAIAAMPDAAWSPEFAIACNPPHPNTLIIAPAEMARRVLATLFPRLKLPIIQWRVGADVTAFQPEEGTLVMWNVERLNAAEQRWLLGISHRHAATQIIAVAATDLFEDVQRGDFCDTLYYRLNTLLIRPAIADPAADLPHLRRLE